MGWMIFVLLFVCVCLYFVYASSIGSGVYGQAMCKGNRQRRAVCLTFDDGPEPIYTTQVLDVLKKYQAPAAFFCIGEKINQHSPIIKRIVEEGHHIGNHSYCHSWKFSFFSRDKMYLDLRDYEDNILVVSKAPTHTFRPPFGVMNPTVVRVARELNYTIIGWSIRSFDTRGESEDRVFRRIIRQIEPGSVILLHDRLPGCASLLTRLLEHLKAINYEVIPLDKMFEMPNLCQHEDE